jgi:RecB family exonuclease
VSELLSWSPARSQRWRACRRQFLFKDLLDAAPAQHDAQRLLRGRVMHAGMEAAIRAVSHGKRRGARMFDAFIDDAQEAMRAHPAADQLSAADLADCVRVLHDALRLLRVPLPASIIGVEHPFSFHYQGVLLEGVIDLVLRTGPTSLRVIDWKSGKIPDRAEAIEGHSALMLYAVATLRCWRWAETVEVGLYSFKYRRSIQLTASDSMRDLVLARLVRDYHAAQFARVRLTSTKVDEVFPASPGDHCDSCVFRSYCPVFAGAQLPTRPGVDVDAERDRIDAMIELSG